MSSATDALLNARRARVTGQLKRIGSDALLVCDPDLAWWLTGSRASQSLWLTRDNDLTDDPTSSWIAAQRSERLAFAGRADAFVMESVRAMAPGEVVDFREAFAVARRPKDPFEVAMLTRASDITRAAFRECRSQLNDDEVTLSAALYRHLRLGGAEGWAYDPSVASGPATSRFWSAPAPTVDMRDHSHTVIDAAGAVRGYKADCTVTIVRSTDAPYGADDVARLAEVIEMVIRAIEAGVDSAAELSRRADACLAAAGYPPLPHALGHGLGLELHEHPHLTTTSAHVLAPGDVFTVEPATYDEDRGGIRLETTVRIGADGSVVRLLDAFDLTQELQANLEEIS